MYLIQIPNALNHFLKESNCNKQTVQVEITIGERTFLGYLELIDDKHVMR